ncbi:MAG: helix-turn-helix transcriptional regulator [Pseudonocardia sp.]|nr:helix-turn-helix transcriptional regulator [Pseudonocardia sp.]
MVESGAPVPPVDGDLGDTLLAAKLRPPLPRPGWVPRPRLLERLRAATARELLLVCAPAGFGKSSLLAEWVRAERRPVAWLSLDEGDNDPVRFWRHVVAGLDGVVPGLAERTLPLIGRPGGLDAAVTTLANSFADGPDGVVLVLDDYHLVAAAPVHRTMQLLVEHLPQALHLVVAGRSDPPLPLARLRARGQLVEVRAAELRLRPAEVAALLRVAVRPELPDEVVTALAERTEGWAVGVQLAALSLQGCDDVAGFVTEFSGSHRFVLDYLTEEVLDRQPPHLQRFLLETSLLERLSGSLCDAVTGRSDSQQLLEAIEAANLFLLPLDETRRWWRYHQLFADLLRVRLRQRHPTRVPALHAAAADWHERHGPADDAIRHALAAGDAERAAGLVEAHMEEHVLQLGEGDTLAGWLAALPPDVVDRRPRLILGQAVVALVNGQVGEVEPLLHRVERAAGHLPVAEAAVDRRYSLTTNVPAAVAIARSDVARQRGDTESEGVFARTALGLVRPEEELLEELARYHAAVADWHAGRLIPAERALTALSGGSSPVGRRHTILRAGYHLGAVQQAQGRLGAAERTYRRALAADGSRPAAGMAHVGLAEVAYQRDDIATALEHATAGIERCRRLSYVPPLVSGLCVLARTRWAQGDRSGSTAALDEAEELLGPASDLHVPVAVVRARLALAAGDIAGAARWVRARGLAVDDPADYRREQEYLVLARVLLAGRHHRQALALLERWEALAVEQERPAGVLVLRVLAATAHAKVGDEATARRLLAGALGRAAPEGHARMFVDEGAPVAALLRELLVGRRLEELTADGLRVPRTYLDRLVAAFARAGTPILPAARRGGAAVPGLVEPLSAREQEVLALLAAGRRNQEIATELVITVDTVKRHVSHLFGKLGVTSRTQAAARAHQLGLLG